MEGRNSATDGNGDQLPLDDNQHTPHGDHSLPENPHHLPESQHPSPENQPPPHEFEGHPQPPANERLENARNFLADEDPDRCLDFENKIKQIERYLEVLKNENVPHDAVLYKDVKSMVTVHRDWRNRITEIPNDVLIQDGPLFWQENQPRIPQPYSTRLVSTETKEHLEEARAGFGYTNQTREDRAPFTVDLQADHAAFIKALTDDAATHPDEVDANTNLLFVESKSYSLAMRDPALIPIWMHPTMGIPRVGLTAEDNIPKAERRGIQRAAIEIALNTMATNQEQHRPRDRFRIVDLPPPYRPAPPETTTVLPLEPSRRPLEQDPYDYTKKLLAFREWKDTDYEEARRMPSTNFTEILDVPENFNGPFTLQNDTELNIATQAKLRTLTALTDALRLAYKRAPRPLLKTILTEIDKGMFLPKLKDAPESLTLAEAHIYLFKSLTEESWDEERQPYGETIPGIIGVDGELQRLQEFERDVEKEIRKNIENEIQRDDEWEITTQSETEDEDENNVPIVIEPIDTTEIPAESIDESGIPPWTPESWKSQFHQIVYNPMIPSTRYVHLRDLVQSINTSRLRIQGPQKMGIAPWNYADANRYLMLMASKRRIHLEDNPGHIPENPEDDLLELKRVSRIPLSGHPENKYIGGQKQPLQWAGVKANSKGQFEVRYNKSGEKGPPILQPNKHTQFMRIADKLGRSIKELLAELAQVTQEDPVQAIKVNPLIRHYDLIEETVRKMIEIRHEDAPKANHITIFSLALELLRTAPDLAEDADFDFQDNPEENMTIEQAATLLQMQLIEEANNNWEYRFPEEEHVWDFARVRFTENERTTGRHSRARAMPTPTKFFSMRRYPPEYQNEVTQEIIKRSGPTLQEKPGPRTGTQTQTPPQGQAGAHTQDGFHAYHRVHDHHGAHDHHGIHAHDRVHPLARLQTRTPPPTQPRPQPGAGTQRQPRTQAQAARDNRALARARATRIDQPLKMDKHIRGQRPMFPFGETPFQSAYLSFRMENELKDVPEFQPPIEHRRGFFSRKRKRERSPSPVNRYALPPIPPNWHPSNISIAHARLDLIEAAQAQPGFPGHDRLDYYYTQDEIKDIEHRQAWLRRRDEIIEGVRLVEQATGKKIADLSTEELHAAQIRVGVDHLTGRVIRPAGGAGTGG